MDQNSLYIEIQNSDSVRLEIATGGLIRVLAFFIDLVVQMCLSLLIFLSYAHFEDFLEYFRKKSPLS